MPAPRMAPARDVPRVGLYQRQPAVSDVNGPQVLPAENQGPGDAFQRVRPDSWEGRGEFSRCEGAAPQSGA